MFDIRNNISPAPTLAPAVRTAIATGSTVDLAGFESAAAVVHFGAFTDGTHTASLQDSADGTTFVAVSTANLIGTFTAITGTVQNNTVQNVGYIGNKRYLRGLFAAPSGTCGNSMTIVRANAKHRG